MWDWVGLAGVLVAAVPLALTLTRELSRGKRLEQAIRLRDLAPEGSYSRASLDRLVDVEAETMLLAAAKRRSQLWIAVAYTISAYTAIIGFQGWLASQPAETNSSVSGWGILVGIAAWFAIAVGLTWRQANDVAAHRDVTALRPWKR